MTETELLANPPEAASPPLKFLRSVDGDPAELRVLSAYGSLWGAIPGDSIWGQWYLAGGKWQRSWFHGDDWEEISG